MENLEPCLSPWLRAEYGYVVKVLKGSVVFTNVNDPHMRAELSKLAPTFAEDVVEYVARRNLRKVIVLDPKGEKELTPEDLRDCDAVVIGGIMGDYPPKGRTWELITKRLPNAIPRNLGREQLTIAGATYVLKQIMMGRTLRDLEFVDGLRISLSLGVAELEIELPYRFPCEGGKIVLPENYVEVVARRSVFYESEEVCEEGRSP